MYPILDPKQPNRYAKKLTDGVNPALIEWPQYGGPAKIHFSDSGIALGSCVRCFHTPCMKYTDEELRLDVFREFPSDNNQQVCPTGAIKLPVDTQAPFIYKDECILCGLCVKRCPVRAIHLKVSGAEINDDENAYFRVQKTAVSQQITTETLRAFEGIRETGIYLLESDEIIGNFQNKFSQVENSQSRQFPNHLARNLLLALGIKTAMRRLGDVNIRMDLVLGLLQNHIGAGEVEIGGDLLDTTRNILDDIAVLIARYKFEKDVIVPIIVTRNLPNARAEYWNFINDIYKVLNIKVASVTIGALVILVWNRAQIVIETGDELYIDSEDRPLRAKIERILGRELLITEGYRGILESPK